MTTAAQSNPSRETVKSRVSSDQRRNQLIDAATRVFSKTGFSGTKTKDIAAEAQINEALLFRHFPTKDDLYAAILEGTDADDWIRAVRTAMEDAKDDVHQFFRAYVARTLDLNRERPELVRLLLYSALEQHHSADVFRHKQINPVLALMTEYIARQQAQGRFTARVPAEHAARIVFGAVAYQGLVITLLRDADTGMSEDDIAEAIAEITLQGLVVRPTNEVREHQ